MRDAHTHTWAIPTPMLGKKNPAPGSCFGPNFLKTYSIPKTTAIQFFKFAVRCKTATNRVSFVISGL